MKLTDDLRQLARQAASPFAAQLLKEDIARLEKLEQMAAGAPDRAAFIKSAMMLGWTQGDLRTFELNPELAAFADAVHGHYAGQDVNVDAAWKAFHQRRMDLLVGCLSRPRLE